MSDDSSSSEWGFDVAGMIIGDNPWASEESDFDFMSGGDAGVDAAESGVAPPPEFKGVPPTDNNFAPWDWMKENPELTTVLGSAVAGGAKSYLDTVRSDRDRAEDARQFDTSRRWSGAFYGREAGDGLVARRRS